MGQPHSILATPMPRSVFKLLWDAIGSGREVFAYVKNITRAGDFYWVFAHVTPSFEKASASSAIIPTAASPTAACWRAPSSRSMPNPCGGAPPRQRQGALARGFQFMGDFVKSKGVSYDELVFFFRRF